MPFKPTYCNAILSSNRDSENEQRMNFYIQCSSIIVFLINTSCTLLQVKFQSKDANPFDTHYWVMVAFFAVLLVHAILLATQIKLRHAIFGKISLLAGALASILLLIILVPRMGWFSLVLWVICFVTVAHASHQLLYDLLYEATQQIFNLLGTMMNRRVLEPQNQQPV